VNSGEDYQKLMEQHNKAILRPIVKIQLAKEGIFLTPGQRIWCPLSTGFTFLGQHAKT